MAPGARARSHMRAYPCATQRAIHVTARLWASLDHGHWGPKLSRSRDGGATWEDVLSLKYPQGARYIVKSCRRPILTLKRRQASPSTRPQRSTRSGILPLAVPVSLAGCMPAPSPAACSSATMAATAGHSTGHCGITRVGVAICLPAMRPVRTAGGYAGEYRLRRVRTGYPFDHRRPARSGSYPCRRILGRGDRDHRWRPTWQGRNRGMTE